MSTPSPSARPLVSIVFSFRNEEEVLQELILRLQRATEGLVSDFEFIFVNDASTDKSCRLLMENAGKDSRIKILTTSRRFGVAECFLAGMKYASGDAVITMDTDLQDPPELIPQLVEKWQAGNTVVHTVRIAREGESTAKMYL